MRTIKVWDKNNNLVLEDEFGDEIKDGGYMQYGYMYKPFYRPNVEVSIGLSDFWKIEITIVKKEPIKEVSNGQS